MFVFLGVSNIFFKKKNSKVLNLGTALLLSGAVFISLLPNVSRAMEKEKEKTSYTIVMGRVKVLEAYGKEIVEYYNKTYPEKVPNNQPSIEITTNNRPTKPVRERFEDDKEKEGFTVFSSLRNGFFLDMYLRYFFYAPHLDPLRPFELTKHENFSFNPRILPEFLFQDKAAYLKGINTRLICGATVDQFLSWISASQNFVFSKSRGLDDYSYKERCKSALYEFTTSEALAKLKTALFASDFQVHKFIFMDDKGSPFYLLPRELRKMISHDLFKMPSRFLILRKPKKG